MKIPVHVLHVFNKPRISTQFIAAYPAMRYRHKISAMGGFDSASCTIMVDRAESEYIYETYIGNRVAVYVDNPAEPIWEGLISRITITLPGIQLTRSLDNMANRISVTSIDTNSATPVVPTLEGSPVNDTASQAIYGIREGTFRRPMRFGTATDTYAAALRGRMLAVMNYPLGSAASAGGSGAIVEIEMIGFYHTLEWEEGAVPTAVYAYRNGSTGVVDVLLAGLDNTTTFFNNADLSALTNNAQTMLEFRSGQTAWQIMQAVTETGDGVVPWVAGITPTDWNTGTRRMYYRASNLNVEYVVRVNDGARIRTTAGTLVSPWTVRADRVLKLADALVGWDGDGNDPRHVYLSFVQYDADSQRVTWQSEDNIELEGALQSLYALTNTNQRYGQRVPSPFF